ncbi:cytochrome c-type biogenesis protein CcmB [Caldithrix abyssi DSM 13497]|uniref:Cytochrome c-type biogenesis protein CcmB n=1 Tax=Caldithrix abyssi DSM 13497 TaxID=880073 RepID=H1XY30_CALAY|nr:heme exporter protein CcmB [Caldithrix abyssi]APF17899.1 heme exporter protein B [Caldithrix abyssi DSM 13497]EHO41957.1 cytochrome c-type biogenesis protein CcmB [Caldithrix abyssi DSM 13497]
MKQVWLIFLKDIQQEFKTRYAINAILLFAIVTLSAVSFSIGTYTATARILASLFWIILFFSSMSGLSHIFIREEETHTADTLKLVARPTSIYLGKFLFNLILLMLLEVILIPLFIAVMNFKILNYQIFLLTLLIGNFGLAAGGTMVAAIISKASTKGALFTVLSFPILLPVLISGISATRKASESVKLMEAQNELQALFAYGVIIIVTSVLLFDFVWNE